MKTLDRLNQAYGQKNMSKNNTTNKKEQMPPRRLCLLTREFEFRGQPIKITFFERFEPKVNKV